MPLITAFYAGLAGLMLILLSVRVIGRRVKARVALGDGGDEELGRRIRAHGNFVEFVPLALILMALIETSGLAPWVVHVLGIPLIVGRAVHAWSITAQSLRARQAGMILTFFVLGVAAVICLGQGAMRIVG